VFHEKGKPTKNCPFSPKKKTSPSIAPIYKNEKPIKECPDFMKKANQGSSALFHGTGKISKYTPSL